MEISESNLSRRDSRFFKIAKDCSAQSDYSAGFKIGCVAVLNGKIISRGHNSEKTNPLQLKYIKYSSPDKIDFKQYKPKLHAEVDCLKSIAHRTDIPWDKVKLYIYRSLIQREHGLARPCSCCMHLIKELGIKHIYYSTDIGYSHEILL